MQRFDLRWSLPLFLFLSLSLFREEAFAQTASSNTASPSYNSTTAGKDEVSSNSSVFSESDLAKLNQQYADEIRKFKKGRAESAEDTKSRYSGILDLHDADSNSVVDHVVGGKGNALEGGLEALLNLPKALSAQDRADAIDKLNSDECAKKYQNQSNQSKNPVVQYCNISPLLLDKGGAHGEGPHRIYDLSDGAKGVSEKAGKAYADRAIQEATAVGRNYTKSVNGGADPGNFAPSIDILRSEANWMSQNAKFTVDATWRTLRLKKIIYDDHYGIPTAYDLVSKKKSQKKPAGSVNKDTAEFVDQETPADFFSKMTVDPVLKIALPGPFDGHDLGTMVRKVMAGVQENTDYAAYDQQVAQQIAQGMLDLWQLAQQRASNLVKDKDPIFIQLKDPSALMAQIAQCMQRDNWCVRGKPTQNKKGNFIFPYEPLPAGKDVGAAFSDTREFIYTRASRALRGPLSQFIATMKSADFNERTHPDLWAKMTKEVNAQIADTLAYQQNLKASGFQNTDRVDPNKITGDQLRSGFMKDYGGYSTAGRMGTQQLTPRTPASSSPGGGLPNPTPAPSTQPARPAPLGPLPLK